MTTALGNRKLVIPEALDEGLVTLPFAFQINGTSDPNNVKGDCVLSRSVVRTSAGLFTFTLTNLPYDFVGGGVTCGCGATEDIVPHLIVDAALTTGVIQVRCMTTATPTDPADDTWVVGHLIVKKTDRRAGA